MVRKDAEIKFRVDIGTMRAAQAKAKELDLPLSQILRQLLREWITEDCEERKEAEPEAE